MSYNDAKTEIVSIILLFLSLKKSCCAAQAEEKTSEPTRVVQMIQSTGYKRILLVDDNFEYAQMIQELLKLEADYEVEVIDSIEVMWARLKKGGYSALILDHNLPDGFGLEQLSQLSASLFYPPVIMITGVGDEMIASEAIKRGAYDYIRKGEAEVVELGRILARAIEMHMAKRARVEAEAKVLYQAWLLDHLSDAIIVIDCSERVTFWNRVAEEILDVSAEQAQGKKIGKIIKHLDVSADVERRLLDLFQGRKENDTLEVNVPAKKSLWVSVTATALTSRETISHGLAVVFRDITEYRSLHEELRLVQVQILEAARLSAIGELASNMAHQINNPLTTVLGEAQILMNELDQESEAMTGVKAIQEAGWRAIRVVERMMNLSAQSDGEQQRVDMNYTLLSAVELSRVQLEQNKIEFNLEVKPSLPALHVLERDLLDLWLQVIHQASLLACKSDEKQIKVRTDLHGNELEVSILISVDSDRGFDPEKIPQYETGISISEELTNRIGCVINTGKLSGKIEVSFRFPISINGVE